MFSGLPFTPGETASLVTAATTANVALPKPFGSGAMARQLRIVSLAANPINFIKFGSSTVVAALTDTPILPGATEVFTVPTDATHVAAIGGAGTMYFTAGFGQ